MNTILEIGLSNALMALVLAIVAAAAATMRKSHPVLAHTLWLLVFVKLLTPPLIAIPIPVLSERLDSLVVRTAPGEFAEPSRTNGNAAVPSDRSGSWVDAREDSGALEIDLSRRSVPDPALASDSENIQPLVAFGLDESSAAADSHPTAAAGASGVRGVVIAVWLAGSMGWLGLSLVSVWRVCRLLAFARPAPSELREEVRQLAERLKIARCPEVLIVSGRISPMVWPIGPGARILLPADLLEQFTREERSTVLVHELAHVRRRDHWVRQMELVCTVLYWWHPAVWWARSQLRRAEEECCDAWVVTTFPESAQAYAAALLKTVVLFSQLPKHRPIPDPISSGVTTTRLLERRLTMIYRQGTPLHLGRVWRVLLVLLAVLVLPIAPGRATWTTASRGAAAEPDASETSVQSDAAVPAGESADGPNDFPQDANKGQPFRLFDGFDGKLELDWEVIQPNPTHVSLEKTPGRLTITSQRGGLHHGSGDNIHMIPNPAIGGGDFVVTTCLEQFHPEAPYQQAGPHIYDDDDNYLKAIIARNGSHVIVGCSWETRGEFGGRDLNATDIEWDRLWLRIIKRGRAYESSCSLDGKEYTVIAERVWGNDAPQRIGLAVMNEDGTSNPLDAAFDFFEVRSLTDQEKNDPLYLERHKLQGTWEVVSSRLGGKALEESPLSRFEFHGIEVTFSENDQRITSKYALHPEKEPKGLALTGFGDELWEGHTRAFEQDHNLINAVYSIEQDRLVICMAPRLGAAAPTELETKEGDGLLLVQLRRMSEAEIAAIRRSSRPAKQLVDGLDADHDEQLTIEEFTSDWPTPQAAKQGREVFQLIDQDGDGMVTVDELKSKPKRAIFLLKDFNADGVLSPNEFSLEPVKSAPPARVHRIFELMDRDNDGAMSFKEYRDRPAESWFVELDTNDDDRLSFGEYGARNATLVQSGRIQGVFAAIDRNGDGDLSLDEFANDPREALFRKQDADGNEKLTLHEFCVWKHTPQQIAAAKQEFARKDTDSDDMLSFKEYAYRSEDADFWKADENGDNRLNRDEFEASRIWAAAGDQLVAFRSLDQNRDDNICLSEFRSRPDSDRPNAARDP